MTTPSNVPSPDGSSQLQGSNSPAIASVPVAAPSKRHKRASRASTLTSAFLNFPKSSSSRATASATNSEPSSEISSSSDLPSVRRRPPSRDHRYLRYNRLCIHQGQHIPRVHNKRRTLPPIVSISRSIERTWTNFQDSFTKTWEDFCGPTSVEVPDRQKEQQAAVGFSFSPAGLLLPYHLGVAECLRHHGILTDDIPIAGASAGALTVAMVGCNVDTEHAMQLFYQAEKDVKWEGMRSSQSVWLRSSSLSGITARPCDSTLSF